jgi:hypothetical protein
VEVLVNELGVVPRDVVQAAEARRRSSRCGSRQDERQIGHSGPSVLVQATNRPCRLSTAPMSLLSEWQSGLLHVTTRLTWMITIPLQRGPWTSIGSSSVAPRVGRRAEGLSGA